MPYTISLVITTSKFDTYLFHYVLWKTILLGYDTLDILYLYWSVFL